MKDKNPSRRTHDDDDEDSTQRTAANTSQQQQNEEQESQLLLLDLFETTFSSQTKQHVVYAFGYGSGVISQEDEEATTTNTTSSHNKEETKVVDMILVVDNAHEFHAANYRTHPRQYIKGLFGRGDPVSRATWLQCHDLNLNILTCLPDSLKFQNPKLWFNLLPSQNIKYGVVELRDLIVDLVDWKYLYVAGRMHKPTIPFCNKQQQPSIKVVPDDTLNVQYQQQTHNLPAALSAALLLIQRQSPSGNNVDGHTSASVESIYTCIAGLSYAGDVRISLGAEDPNKIKKLVGRGGGGTQQQLQRFNKLYEQSRDRLVRQGILSIDSRDTSIWTWDSANPKAQSQIISYLPKLLQQKMIQHSNKDLHEQIISIVGPSTRYQTLKGVATAGISQSVKYSLRKLSKGIFKR